MVPVLEGHRRMAWQSSDVTKDEPDDWSRRSAERAVRIAAGVEKVSNEWRSYFALVIAAPDEATLIRWTCERFRVDVEVATVLLDQQLKTLTKRVR